MFIASLIKVFCAYSLLKNEIMLLKHVKNVIVKGLEIQKVSSEQELR